MVTVILAPRAARAVLMDLFSIFGEYGDSIVVAGGWVPSLSPSKSIMPHVGTTDVDLMLDYRRIPEQGKPTSERSPSETEVIVQAQTDSGSGGR